MIYKEQLKIPHIHFINGDYRDNLGFLRSCYKPVIVTDPPFNIGFKYGTYKDNMPEDKYYEMLAQLLAEFPAVIVLYPEQLHKLSVAAGRAPERVVSWVYNTNLKKQHRDIGFYGISPNFKGAIQEYRDPNDPKVKQRIALGFKGGAMYDWWKVGQVRNTSKEKTAHPCQMPVEVMKNIIAMLPEDCTVIDCFMGSGSTAVACIDLGYDFVGIEIDEQYYEIAKGRINANFEVQSKEGGGRRDDLRQQKRVQALAGAESPAGGWCNL